jgi:hypothetical protein
VSTEQAPAPVGLPTLLAWRRTGLILSVAAVVSFAGFFASTIASCVGTFGVVLGAIACACSLMGLGFLRRAWSDPEVRDDLTVVRARRMSDIAMTAWGIAIILSAIFAIWPDTSEALSWLSVVYFLLGCVAVAAFVGMLAIAVKWQPVASTD